jgi:putative transposase
MSLPRLVIPGRTYMVTRRCTQRQFLLRPDPDTTQAFLFCLAYAAKVSGVLIVAFLAHSNHHHTIVVDKEGRLPQFLETFHKLMAKHQNALRGRWENFWASESTSIVELIDADDILAKMVYALTNPVKDHIVERADQWPGASSLRANLDGTVISTKRPWRFFRKESGLAESLPLHCHRPPGFEHLSQAEWRKVLEDAVRAVEKKAAGERRACGRGVLGRHAVLRQRPTERPHTHEARRALSPRVAAANKWARIEALQRSKAFLAAYRAARDLWQAGKQAVFPPGTYWLRRFASVPVDPLPAPA